MPTGNRYPSWDPMDSRLILSEDTIDQLEFNAPYYGEDALYVRSFVYLLTITSGVGGGKAKDKAGLSRWDYKETSFLADKLANPTSIVDENIRLRLRLLVEKYYRQIGAKFGADFGKLLKENRERTKAQRRDNRGR